MVQFADIVLRNCEIADVYSGELRLADIAIANGRILSSSGRFDQLAAKSVDCTGLIAAPGLIDAHMHVDTTFLAPSELARAIVPLGTTSLIVDNTNNAHTGGAAAVAAMAQAFAGLPLRGFMVAPSYCPLDPRLETAAVTLGAEEIGGLLKDGAIGIGETVWSKIALENRDYLRAMQICRAMGKRVSGHGGEIRRGAAQEYDAYVTAGIDDDHCIGRGEDILPRLRRGLELFLVECSGRRGQLRPLLDQLATDGLPLRRACLCLDNLTLMDMVGEGYGYQNFLIGIAEQAGIGLVDRLRMASLHPAEHYRLSRDIGSLGAGRHADILLLKAPGIFPPEQVYVGGQLVAERGVMVIDPPRSHFPPAYRRTVDLGKTDPGKLQVQVTDGAEHVRVKAFSVHDGDAFNDAFEAVLPVVRGVVQPDIAADILSIAVIERYGVTGGIGNGFVHGMGFRRGAVASSMSIPSNNIVVVGSDPDDMWAAARHVEQMQGGFAVVLDGKVLAEVPLPIGGILSEQPYVDLLADVVAAEDVIRTLGSTLKHPLFTIAQTVLSTLPDLGLTDKGLVDARRGAIVPLILETI